MPNTTKIKEPITAEVHLLDPRPDNNLFVIKKANDWLIEAKDLPPPSPLYDQLWFEGETAFLFGGTGTGKSLYAVQMGKEIAKEQPVLFFDFELSLIQFAKRYFNHDWTCHENFPENFYRVEFKRNITYSQDQLITEIHRAAIEYNSKVLIIDNLTWILAASEKTIDAGNLMKEIASLKRDNDYSILIIAHTPKRDETRPINVNDMAGSMVLTNFIDTSFCISKSFKDSYMRYIKQVKVRSSDMVYGYDSVKVLQLSANNDGFLNFEDVGTERENEHLRNLSDEQRIDKKNKAMEMMEQGKSYAEISQELGISKGVISKYKKQTESYKDDLPF